MLNIDVRRHTFLPRFGDGCLLGMLNIDVRRLLKLIGCGFYRLLGMLNIDVRRQNSRGGYRL